MDQGGSKGMVPEKECWNHADRHVNLFSVFFLLGDVGYI